MSAMGANVWTVAVGATVTCLATGLGALPFLAVRRPPRAWLGVASAAAVGFMTAASLALVVEGLRFGVLRTLVGAGAGAAFITFTSRFLHEREVTFGALSGIDALKALTIVAVMTVHSLTEGVGVGVSYGGGDALGVFVTVAIAIHNIPEGLAISLVLVPRGARVRTAAWWSVFSSLPQPLVAVPAFLFVEQARSALPIGLGFAAGAMVWLSATELVPDARENGSARATLATGVACFVAMCGLQALLLQL
ncbi:MAG: ZIP family metal transporter [Gaiellaceae bacterium]